MVIKYIAYTWQGIKVEGVLDVDQEDEARELLRRQELIPYRLSTVRPRRSLAAMAPFLFRPKPQELIEFTRGTAALIRSGIPLREAAVMFRDESHSLGMKAVLRQIVTDIEGGIRFSEAAAKHPSVFSSFYVRILKFGEATGAMAQAMQQMADNLEKTSGMKDKVRAALVYPVISLAVAVVVAFVLVTFSLPALIGLLEEFGGELPRVTQLLITIADFIKAYRTHMFIVGAVVGVGGFGYTRTAHGAHMRDRAVLRIPMVSGVMIKSSLFDFASIFHTLLQAGIPTVESLRLSSESITNRVLRERLERVIADVVAGGRLGPSFKEHWPSPSLLSQAVTTGEASGSLSTALRGLADYYEQESVKAISGATELIQPAVIILVAGLVGFVATAVMSGIYSALNSIE